MAVAQILLSKWKRGFCFKDNCIFGRFIGNENEQYVAFLVVMAFWGACSNKNSISSIFLSELKDFPLAVFMPLADADGLPSVWILVLRCSVYLLFWADKFQEGDTSSVRRKKTDTNLKNKGACQRQERETTHFPIVAVGIFRDLFRDIWMKAVGLICCNEKPRDHTYAALLSAARPKNWTWMERNTDNTGQYQGAHQRGGHHAIHVPKRKGWAFITRCLGINAQAHPLLAARPKNWAWIKRVTNVLYRAMSGRQIFSLFILTRLIPL